MPDVQTVVFCDFDGTAAERDVGYNLFRHFTGGRNEALLPDWKAGRLSTRDCLRLQAEMVQASRGEILAFLDQFELEATFPEFVGFCRAKAVPVIIVSEGMDFYIRKLLERHDLGDLEVLCNIGHLEDGRLRIEFPYSARRCEGCGNCKAARMAEYRKAVGGDCRVVFVGDGYSDACAAGEADTVFAKKDLELYCQEAGILYHKYGSFNDVTSRLIQQCFPAS